MFGSSALRGAKRTCRMGYIACEDNVPLLRCCIEDSRCGFDFSGTNLLQNSCEKRMMPLVCPKVELSQTAVTTCSLTTLERDVHSSLQMIEVSILNDRLQQSCKVHRFLRRKKTKGEECGLLPSSF